MGNKRYIYRAIRRDNRYLPPKDEILKEFPTQTETIKWLEENGGGIYRNILHNVEFYVSRRKK